MFFMIFDPFIYWLKNGLIQPVPFKDYTPFYLVFPPGNLIKPFGNKANYTLLETLKIIETKSSRRVTFI